MTRLIRAWDPTSKKMHVIDHMGERGPASTSWEIGINQWNGKLSVAVPLLGGGYLTTAYMMYSIGRRDRNGKELFDLDIVRYVFDASVKDEFIVCVIEYNLAQCAYQLFPIDKKYGTGGLLITPSADLVLVGNVYEQPDILPDSWWERRGDLSGQ